MRSRFSRGSANGAKSTVWWIGAQVRVFPLYVYSADRTIRRNDRDNYTHCTDEVVAGPFPSVAAAKAALVLMDDGGA